MNYSSKLIHIIGFTWYGKCIWQCYCLADKECSKNFNVHNTCTYFWPNINWQWTLIFFICFCFVLFCFDCVLWPKSYFSATSAMLIWFLYEGTWNKFFFNSDFEIQNILLLCCFLHPCIFYNIAKYFIIAISCT